MNIIEKLDEMLFEHKIKSIEKKLFKQAMKSIEKERKILKNSGKFELNFLDERIEVKEPIQGIVIATYNYGGEDQQLIFQEFPGTSRHLYGTSGISIYYCPSIQELDKDLIRNAIENHLKPNGDNSVTYRSIKKL